MAFTEATYVNLNSNPIGRKLNDYKNRNSR